MRNPILILEPSSRNFIFQVQIGQFKFRLFLKFFIEYVDNQIIIQVPKWPKSKSLSISQGQPPKITKTIFTISSNFRIISYQICQNLRFWNFSNIFFFFFQNSQTHKGTYSLFKYNWTKYILWNECFTISLFLDLLLEINLHEGQESIMSF